MKKPNIVFVGHVVIDHNKVEQTSYIRWGSPAMFMTKYFKSHFGLEPTIIASYGEDFLQYAGSINLLPKQPNLTYSTAYENIVTNGHRTQYCHHADAPLPKISPDIEAALRAADILFLAPLAPSFFSAYVAQIMHCVSPNCLKVLSPQGYLRQFDTDDLVHPREFVEAADILPYFNVMILSDEDHPQADTMAHTWKASSPDTEIIVTLNARGADIIQSKGVQHIPTTPVPLEQIVDSTGLGDIFSAAVAYYLSQHGDLVTAVKAAHLATREKLLSFSDAPQKSLANFS
jgi:sugar/nucleoside kinase (ribokinase family)